jgi:hypothetical protein
VVLLPEGGSAGRCDVADADGVQGSDQEPSPTAEGAKSDGPDNASQKKKQSTRRSFAAGLGTAVPVAGLIVTIVINWDTIHKQIFGQPPPPPIKMSHADFVKLPYSRQLDICIPYLTQNIDRGYSDWETALSKAGGPLPPGDRIARFDDGNADGQSIDNLHLTIQEMALMSSDYDLGKNLLACAYTPDTDKLGRDPYTEIGSGIITPYGVDRVLSESPVYYQSDFHGYRPEGRSSKIVKVANGDIMKERNFTLVGGDPNSNKQIWVESAEVLQGDKDWVEDLSTWSDQTG